MNISDIFIRRPIATTLLMVGIFVFGLRAAAGRRAAERPENASYTTPGTGSSIISTITASSVASEPNALQNSDIGIKGNEEFAPGWAFVFDLESGFDSYSLQFCNGPGSAASACRRC